MANTANSAAFVRVIDLRHNSVNLVWATEAFATKSLQVRVKLTPDSAFKTFASSSKQVSFDAALSPI